MALFEGRASREFVGMTRLRISALAALAALAPVLACVAPGSLAAQTQSGASRAEPSETSSVAATISAVRTSTPPIIDGRDDDAIWRRAPTISGFTQWMPTEGQRPRFRTEAKVAYDAANLYVFDGRDDDAIWRRTPTISGFTQWMPTEGQRPRFRTEAKVAYDAANLYVFVR